MRRSLWAGDREVELRPNSFDVLRYLATNLSTMIQALIILSVSAQILMRRRGDSTAGERRWKF